MEMFYEWVHTHTPAIGTSPVLRAARPGSRWCLVSAPYTAICKTGFYTQTSGTGSKAYMMLPSLPGLCDSSTMQLGQKAHATTPGLPFCRAVTYGGPQSDPGAKPGRTALLQSPDSAVQPARSRLGASTAPAGPAAECVPLGLAISGEQTPGRQEQAAAATPVRAAGRTSTARAPLERTAPGAAGAASSVRPAAQHLQGEAAAEDAPGADDMPGAARLAADGPLGARSQQAATVPQCAATPEAVTSTAPVDKFQQAATRPQCAVTPDAGTGTAPVGRPVSDNSADRGAAGEACCASQAVTLVVASVRPKAEAMLATSHSQLLTRCLAMMMPGLHPDLW